MQKIVNQAHCQTPNVQYEKTDALIENFGSYGKRVHL